MRKVGIFAIIVLAFVQARAEDVPITGVDHPRLHPFDDMMVRFLQDHHVPGGAMAVTRFGRLVYARGFGWADTAAHRPVEPTSLFRVAGISKTITSAAVLHLVGDKKLSLGDHPFIQLNIPSLLPPGTDPDPRINEITVLNLLQNRGGFDRDSGDPMYQSLEIARECGVPSPPTATDIIRAVESRKLATAPGEKERYTDFGYSVLGRVIEQASQTQYENYVRQNVLAPLGIHGMKLGKTLATQRAEGEVTYYTINSLMGESVFPALGRTAPKQYGGWCLESMDSSTGWISSAVDLVRFASSLDDVYNCPVLEAKQIKTMFGRPVPGRDAVWFGCGWLVRDANAGRINTWLGTSLDGCSGFVMRRWDGVDWAILFNQDTNIAGKSLNDLIDDLSYRAADAVSEWPSGVDQSAEWP